MNQAAVDILQKQHSEESARLRVLVRTRVLMAWGLVAVMALMLLQGTDPDEPRSFVEKATFFKFTLTFKNIDPRSLNSIFWLLYAGLAVESYQRSLLVEFQRKYLRDLESRLNELIDLPLFDHQIRSRPLFFQKSAWFYLGVFALIIGGLPLVKIGAEVIDLSMKPLSLTFFGFDLIMISVFYCYSWYFLREIGEWAGLTPPASAELNQDTSLRHKDRDIIGERR